MKIVFLNTWNGKIREGISNFIKSQSKDADIFCFQEVYQEMQELAGDILLGYAKYSACKYAKKEGDFPQATYVKKGIQIISSGTILEKERETGLALYIEMAIKDKKIFIVDFHGASMPVDELDCPAMILQSQELIKFSKDNPGPKIIGGDFNLLPETKSIRMFEENGFRNLIKEYKIPTTRNQLAWANYPNNPQLFSDYVFLSPEIKVKSFLVVQNEISDHLPMILDFQLPSEVQP